MFKIHWEREKKQMFYSTMENLTLKWKFKTRIYLRAQVPDITSSSQHSSSKAIPSQLGAFRAWRDDRRAISPIAKQVSAE